MVISVRRALAFVFLSCSGCAATTPSVPEGPQPSDARGVSVPFPPPPATVEVIPLQRRESCAWRDGYWDFRAGEWQWQKGEWVVPDADCYYAAPETRFESTPAGVTLVYRRGAWFERQGSKACEAPPSCADVTPSL